MRQTLLWLVGVGGLVGCVAAANLRRVGSPVEVDWRLFRPSPPLIAVALPTRGPIARTVAAKGVVEPVRQARVVAKVGGKVAEVCVEEGATVRAGDTLVKLDPAPFRSRVDAAKSRVEAAVKNQEVAEAHLRDVEKDPGAATSPAPATTAPNPLAGFPGGPVPPVPTVGPTRLEAARTNLDGWKRERKAAEAAEVTAQTELDRATIRAPLAGVVEDLSVEVGDDVLAGAAARVATATAPAAPAGLMAGFGPADAGAALGEVAPTRGLCTILDPDQVRVRAWIDEGDVGLVAVDQSARVFLPDEPTRPVSGRVARLAARGRPAGEVVAYAATVELAAVGRRARPGMRVNVEVEVSRAEDLLGVPVQAVVHRKRRDLALADPPGETTGGVGFRAVPVAAASEVDPEYVKAVFVVEGDRVRLRPIETGLSDERRVQVVAGLGGADRIVVGPFRALDALEDRMTVRLETAPGGSPAPMPGEGNRAMAARTAR